MKLAVRNFSLLLIITFAGVANAQNASAKKDLPNLYQVSSTLTRGGQPTEAGILELKRIGIKTIINLRSANGRSKKEKAWAEAAGLKFINVPLSNWFEPKDTQIDKIIVLIDDPANHPVFVHCKRGADRTGTVVAVYRISHEGWNAKRANDEAEKFGLGWWQFWMKDYVNDYYRDMKAGTPKPEDPSRPK